MVLMNNNIKKVLITGIGGSGGSYLADYILANHQEIEVHGISRWHSTSQVNNLYDNSKVQIHQSDLNDFSSLYEVIKLIKPDYIFHLAAYANVRASFTNPSTVLTNNIISTSNLFEVIRLLNLDPVIQLCSTSEVYGQVDKKYIPIKEETPIRPSSPYAVSKVAQDLLGYTYFISYGLKIVRTRMFTYLNPRRSDLFASAFARQIARIELGFQKKLYHGNLNSIRTLLDVRDAMEAYWLALMHCKSGEVYNIGGTHTVSVGDFLDLLRKKSSSNIVTELDPKLLRPSDVTLQIPDSSKFISETGWKEKYSVEESIDFLLEYWRKKIKRENI